MKTKIIITIMIVSIFFCCATRRPSERGYTTIGDKKIITDELVPRFINDDIILFSDVISFSISDNEELISDMINQIEDLGPTYLTYDYNYERLCYTSDGETVTCIAGNENENLVLNEIAAHVSHLFFSADGETVFFYTHPIEHSDSDITVDWRVDSRIMFHAFTENKETIYEEINDCIITPSVSTNNTGIALSDGSGFVFFGYCQGGFGLFRDREGVIEKIQSIENYYGQPYLINNDQEIIYLSPTETGARDVFWMDLEEREPVNLTHGNVGDLYWYPSYNTLREEFVWCHNLVIETIPRDVALANNSGDDEMDSSNLYPTVITEQGLFPDVSPSGGKLIYLWEGSVYLYSYETTSTEIIYQSQTTDTVEW